MTHSPQLQGGVVGVQEDVEDAGRQGYKAVVEVAEGEEEEQLRLKFQLFQTEKISSKY